MKTANLVLPIWAVLSFSCEKGAAPTAQPTTLEKQPDAGCPHPEYDPPEMAPGTGCIDPCQFVYEGWVGFEEGILTANCRLLPLSSPALSFSVDSSLVREVGVGYRTVLRVRASGVAYRAGGSISGWWPKTRWPLTAEAEAANGARPRASAGPSPAKVASAHGGG